MKCPKCGGPIITFGNEWECVSCGNYGSFLDDKYDEEEKKKDSGKREAPFVNSHPNAQ